MDSKTYVVCGYKSWNKRVFDQKISTLPGVWHYIESADDLSKDLLEKLMPTYVFFLHWSWKVTQEITENFCCINFHMTDLPYGRGGSPLQNLILRGHTKTKLTAFRMTQEMDAGPVYLKKDLDLSGTAQEIFERATELSAEMIATIVDENMSPVEQEGEVVIFERRTPDQSRIPQDLDTNGLYDFIRMLDGEGYPSAFIEDGKFRYELRDATQKSDSIEAKVRILPTDI